LTKRSAAELIQPRDVHFGKLGTELDLATQISVLIAHHWAEAVLAGAIGVATAVGYKWLDRLDDGLKISTARKVIFYMSVGVAVAALIATVLDLLPQNGPATPLKSTDGTKVGTPSSEAILALKHQVTTGIVQDTPATLNIFKKDAHSSQHNSSAVQRPPPSRTDTQAVPDENFTECKGQMTTKVDSFGNTIPYCQK
jgi:hypothetical protein